eukprot:scaffold105676_cov51-Phaeocystis_antarctica.AAC.6
MSGEDRRGVWSLAEKKGGRCLPPHVANCRATVAPAHRWPTARPPLSSGGSPQDRSRCSTTHSPPRRRLSLPAPPPPPRPSSCRPIRQALSLRHSQRSRLTRRARRPRSRRARAPARASTHRSGSSPADRWPCSTPCSARQRQRSAPEERRRLERRRRCAHRRSTQPQPHPHPQPQPQPQPYPQSTLILSPILTLTGRHGARDGAAALEAWRRGRAAAP